MVSKSVQPRGIVLVNGTRVAWKDIEVNNNGYYQSDTFRVTIPLQSQVADLNRDWWASQDALEVSIYVGFPVDVANYTEADLDLLITGRVDNIPHELVSDVVVLTGRDYTADLIDTKISDKWPNKTASAIATLLAERHGLTPVVTATKTKAGTYYDHDHAKLSLGMSEWDLLTWLAKEETFQVYVSGNELHFGPQPSSPPVYEMQWTDATDTSTKAFNGASLTFERNLTLAKDIIVKVKSWHHKKKEAFVKVARATHKYDKVLSKGRRGITTPQEYSYTFPNLTPDQAQQKAYAILSSITKHQIKMSAMEIPATNDVTPRHIIRVNGTGSYDQDYHVDSILRRLSIASGYTMDIVAKNHDVNSTVTMGSANAANY